MAGITLPAAMAAGGAQLGGQQATSSSADYDEATNTGTYGKAVTRTGGAKFPRVVAPSVSYGGRPDQRYVVLPLLVATASPGLYRACL